MGKFGIKTGVRASLFVGAAMVLSACELGLDELGNAIDRPPETGAFDANGQLDSARPDEDARGIIQYPTYAVAVAQRQETVGDVANRIAVDPNRLATYNGLTPQTELRKGEVLSIPPGALDGTSDFQDNTQEALDSAPDPSPVIQDTPEPVRHVVKQGETAFSIARIYNVSVTSLASWNGLDSDLNVRVGQRLLIPTTQLPPQDEVAVPAPPTADEALPEDKPAPQPVARGPKFVKPVDGNIIRKFDGQGIDYGAAVGTQVRASGSGTVANVLSTNGGAKIVLLRHDNNVYTVYSNVTNVALKKGNKVSQGENVGIVAGGNPPFLHFEVRKGTEAVDPAGYLK
ncbi:MAG: LysM peptidoglycan-binding domain-containing protein [Pseudomonadota bacterium]